MFREFLRGMALVFGALWNTSEILLAPTSSGGEPDGWTMMARAAREFPGFFFGVTAVVFLALTMIIFGIIRMLPRSAGGWLCFLFILFVIALTSMAVVMGWCGSIVGAFV